MPPPTDLTPTTRTMRGSRVAVMALLWAAPIGIAFAIAVLVASAPYFQPGPDTLTAGDTRAWNAIWSALGVVAAAFAAGFIANLVWLVQAWRRAHRPRSSEWIRVTLHLLGGVGFAWFWLGR